jgi:hypothetical protein
MDVIRTEQIEFVIQRDELTDQFVLHVAAHSFIVLVLPSIPGFCFDRVFACRKPHFSFRVTCPADHYLRHPVGCLQCWRAIAGSRKASKGQRMLKLDYISCILTIISTVLVGKKLWQGWIIAGANSILICVIGMRSAQFGFVPANLFCIGLYANNLRNWRPKTQV